MSSNPSHLDPRASGPRSVGQLPEHLARLCEVSGDLICVASSEGMFLGLNPAWETALGYTVEELMARPCFDFVHAEDLGATIEEFGRLKQGKPTRLFTNRYRTKSGDYRWLSWTADAEGDVVYGVARDVTFEKQNEEQAEAIQAEAAASRAILDSIRQVQRLTLVGANPGTIFDFLLGEFLKVTESEYGFIGEVFVGDDGRPFLRTHAITNIAWNEETRRFYDENAPAGLDFFNMKTLFGAVITSTKPLIANDPTHDPRRGGLPEGHPDMNAFLGLPLQDGDGMVGMLGIANRPGGYDQDLLDFLDPLASTTARLIRSYRQRRESEELDEN